MRFLSLALFAAVCLYPAHLFACHPVLKCVEPNGANYTAYFGFEGGENNLPIGSKNKFSGASGCSASGQNCGQGTRFLNNGPHEADLFGSDSTAYGKSQLAVTFSSSVTWTLSGGSVTATKKSKACAVPTATPTQTPTTVATNTPTRTPTRTATPSSTATPPQLPTGTATPLPTATFVFTVTPDPTATPIIPTPQPSMTPTPPAATPTFTPTINIEILDCAGVPNGTAVVDCCGVCGGDGTSCPELCKEIDNTAAKKTIRREVKSITDSTLKRIKQELKCSKSGTEAKKRKSEVLFLRRQIAAYLAGYEDHMKLCETPYCTRTSYVELATEIESSVKRLVKIDKLSQRAAMKACCKGGSCGGGKAGPNNKKNMTELINNLPEEGCD